MSIASVLTLVLLVSTNLFGFTNPAKILSVFPFPGPSQYFFGSAVLKRLAEQGHEVTSISVFPQKEPLKNFRDVAVMENANLYKGVLEEYTSAKDIKPLQEQYQDMIDIAEKGMRNVFENSQVQTLMQQEKFDLIIVEIVLNEAILGLGEYFQAPVIAISTLGTAYTLDYLVGNPSPPSYIPHICTSYENNMNVLQRFGNFVTSVAEILGYNFLVLPRQERLYNKFFPNAIRTLDEARKNVSLVLLNNHFTLNVPRPYVTNMIEVGGLHIKEKSEPLPQDLQEFLDEATEGAIYFSLGSNVKSKDLPQEKLKIFIDTFRELKLKVLWKFELENMPNKPNNVLIKKWFPQTSVLAHPNVKLFISHGGLLSTTETVYHAKPILGIPFLGDQFMNVKYAVIAGYALSLHLPTITKDSFKRSVEELWENPKYTQAAERLSKQFRDQPMTPMATAIYWVEYVLRHEGAGHMQSAGQVLNFWQYHNIDVYAIILAGLVTIGLVLYGMVRVVRKLRLIIAKSCKKSHKTKVKRN